MILSLPFQLHRQLALLSLLALFTLLLIAPLHAQATEPLQVRAGFEQQTLQGYSRAFSTATIASEVAGRILQVNYDVGDTITSEPLLQIDQTFIDLTLQEIAIALEQNKIQQQQAALRTSWLQREFDRRKKLVDQGRVSQVAYEEIEQQRDQSRLEEKQLVQQQQQLHVQQQTSRERQHRHQPRAHKNWRISERLAEPGEQVNVAEPLFKIQNLSRLLVPLTLNRSQLAALQLQNEATLEGQNVHFNIYTISPAFDERTRKIQVELEVIDFSGQPREGLLFKLSLSLPQIGLMVPEAAITRRYDRPQIQLAATEEFITIQILDRQDDWVKIATSDKLTTGTQLIAAPSEVQ